MHTLSTPSGLLGQFLQLRKERLAPQVSEVARLGAAAPAAPAWSDYINGRLGDADALAGVPLSYLVPDPALLPPEGLRFFAIDPGWVLALRRGMLSAGMPDAVRPEDDTGAAPGAGLTGLLLSSALVAQYPGLIVRAWSGANLAGVDPYDPASGATPVNLVRRQNLTPRVLLCVFESAPDLVVIEEPHGLSRLGVRWQAGQPVVALRDHAGMPVTSGGQVASVPVPFRGNAADGVVDVTALAQALQTALGTAVGASTRPPDPSRTSSALALQLLQPPVRQRFSR